MINSNTDNKAVGRQTERCLGRKCEEKTQENEISAHMRTKKGEVRREEGRERERE